MTASDFDRKAAAWVEKTFSDAYDVLLGSVEFDMHVDTSYCETCGPEHYIEVIWRQPEPIRPTRRLKPWSGSTGARESLQSPGRLLVS